MKLPLFGFLFSVAWISNTVTMAKPVLKATFALTFRRAPWQ